MRVLYLLLEKLGENHFIITQSAYTALHKVATLCGKKGIPELLVGNVDYLVDAINLRLKYLYSHYH